MKTIALFACLGFLVACGEKESTTPDTTPDTSNVEKMGDKTPPAKTAESAETRTITVAIDGMT